MQKPACKLNRQFFDIVTLLSLFIYHRYTDPDPEIRSVSLDYESLPILLFFHWL